MSKKPASTGSRSARDGIRQMFQEANRHHVAGNLAFAEVGYRNILKLQKHNFDALHMLAVIGYQTDQMVGCLELFEQAKRVGPTTCDFFVNYGAALYKVKRFEAAIYAYDKALALKSDQYEALLNKGSCLIELRRFDESIAVYERAVAIRSQDAAAWEGLGRAVASQGNLTLGLSYYERAIDINPKLVSALISTANIYKDLDLLTKALSIYDRALSFDPLNPIARIHRGLVLLRIGRLADGWRGYEGRFWYLDAKIPRPSVPPVYWEGEALTGKAILVWAEQGVGDQIIYGSMLPDLVNPGGKVTVLCDQRLVAVFARSFPMIHFVGSNADQAMSKPSGHFDFQTTMATLGRFFRPEMDRFPNTKSYLKANSTFAAQLKQRYGAKTLIGISWASKSPTFGKAKSSSLKDWLPILNHADVQFVSLQYGDVAEEVAAFKAEHGIDILIDQEIDPLTNLDGFFAQVSAMDLVISVSNTTVHVAGSLGVETWTMVPRGDAALWYWFLDRSDSPWYPSMRLFRQSVPGQWSDVIEQVSGALESWLHSDRCA